MENKLKENVEIAGLYKSIQELIETAKSRVAIKVNSEITILYYNIGKLIKENILKLEKPEYGKSVINKLSEKLMEKYGRGYSRANIFRMIKFYEYFKDLEISRHCREN